MRRTSKRYDASLTGAFEVLAKSLSENEMSDVRPKELQQERRTARGTSPRSVNSGPFA